ncbi:hypothetical protein LTR08_008654 [Meristemomyces frigidus]|nr:hypothetical protein LTR08_008654 [Meristemomyces frigidus]
MGTSGFPQWSDGDVTIQLSSSPFDKYIVHSYVLSLHSPWFKASLSERWNGGDASSKTVFGSSDTGGRDGHKSDWVYELHFDKCPERQPQQRWQQAACFIFPEEASRQRSNFKAAIKLDDERLQSVRAHRDLLRILYHLAPGFSHESFDEAKASILQLATLADFYGCESIVELPVASHLRFHYQAIVLETCVHHPVDMLEFAVAIKSDWVFKEAATNLVGRSNRFFGNAKERLLELGIADLMNTKRARFCERLRACDARLSRVSTEALHGKWQAALATSAFRHFLCDRLKQGQGSDLCPGYANVYHMICSSSLEARDCRRQHALLFAQTMFRAAPHVIKADDSTPWVDKIFASAAAILEPLRSRSVTARAPDRSDKHRALTFVGVAEHELPWAKK